TLELARVAIDPGRRQQGRHDFAVSRRERLLAGVGTETVNPTPHVDHRLVQGVAQTRARVATDHQPAALGHETRHVADAAANDDIAALQRDGTAAGGIALDDNQPAPSRGRGAVRGIALDTYHPGHDVLRQSAAGVAVDGDVGPLV